MTDWRPMSEFDPSKPALVHDQFNDDTPQWEPDHWADEFKQTSVEWCPGVMSWNGMLLDGWQPL